MDRPNQKNRSQPSSFSSLKDLITSQFEHLAKGRLSKTLMIQKNWESAVGPLISRHSRVLYVKDETLFIGVDNSTWLNELNLIRQCLLEQVNQILHPDKVEDLRFKINQ